MVVLARAIESPYRSEKNTPYPVRGRLVVTEIGNIRQPEDMGPDVRSTLGPPRCMCTYIPTQIAGQDLGAQANDINSGTMVGGGSGSETSASLGLAAVAISFVRRRMIKPSGNWIYPITFGQCSS